MPVTSKMMKNDPFAPLFALSPLAAAAIVWVWGFGSLFLIAIRTNPVQSVLLRHPGFMVGDFLLLPLAAFLITLFYRHVNDPVTIVTHRGWSLAGVIIATVLTLVSILRNNLAYVWFIPHGTFYWFMAYTLTTFFPRGLLQLTLGTGEKRLWLIWIVALFAVCAHQILPIIFGPKTFPHP